MSYSKNCISEFLEANSWHKSFHLCLSLWIWEVWEKWEKSQNFEYLKNEKSFLDKIKSIFHSFWRSIIWWKKKKQKQALNCFFIKLIGILLNCLLKFTMHYLNDFNYLNLCQDTCKTVRSCSTHHNLLHLKIVLAYQNALSAFKKQILSAYFSNFHIVIKILNKFSLIT